MESHRHGTNRHVKMHVRRWPNRYKMGHINDKFGQDARQKIAKTERKNAKAKISSATSPKTFLSTHLSTQFYKWLRFGYKVSGYNVGQPERLQPNALNFYTAPFWIERLWIQRGTIRKAPTQRTDFYTVPFLYNVSGDHSVNAIFVVRASNF